MLVVRGLDRVLGDLATLGYDARWGVVGAIDAGAPHKRDRIWIVAHAKSTRTRKHNRRIWAGIEGTNRREKSETLQMAHTTQLHGNGGDDHAGIGVGGESIPESGNDGRAQAVADAGSERGQLSSRRRLAAIKEPWSDCAQGGAGSITREWWATEPDLGRVAHGVAARVDRLRCIGNGQVPAVARLAWSLLAPTT